jgi:Uncharacterized protein family UPF0029
MSRKRPRTASPSTLSAPNFTDPHNSHQTFRSGAIKDRSSTFIALFSPTAPTSHLQIQPELQAATHRIVAWRKLGAQRALLAGSKRLYDSGHDDDGEKYAGKRLEKVLMAMDVEGAVVVARWYGGVLLGPVRFTHIENCARDAIGKWKREVGSMEDDGHAARKRKVEDETKEEKSALINILEQRDHSISALRGLLREKTEEASAERSGKQMADVKDVIVTPVKAVNYSAMPFPALQRLENARDATISWILKEIEKLEQQQQPQQEETIHRQR